MELPDHLHYHQLGDGPKSLIAFHGVGQTGEDCYRYFSAVLSRKYTIYAIDLNLFGVEGSVPNTPDGATTLITKSCWETMLSDFLERQNINHFDLAGFSMGGRFALATLEKFHDRVGKVFLMAPDGVKDHVLYAAATRFAFSRKLLRGLLNRPERLLSIAQIFQKLGFVSRSQVRFAARVLQSPERADAVYYSWVAFRALRFDIPELYKKAQKSHTQVWLFMGQYDEMIKVSDVDALSALLPPNHLVEFDCGHNSVVARTADFLIRINQS